MADSTQKQDQDLKAMKRIAREVFYPNTTTVFNIPSSDEAFIPEHVKQEARLELQDTQSNSSTNQEDADLDAFLPPIDSLGDRALARDVFFPQDTTENSPKYISNYYAEILQLLEETQSAISLGQTSYAKKLYNELRLSFLSSSIDDSDRKVFFEKIQSLYDQINLKHLEEEAKKRLLK